MVSRTLLKVVPAGDRVVIQGFGITETEFESLLSPSPQYTHLNGVWTLNAESSETSLLMAGKVFTAYLLKNYNISASTSTSENQVTCTWYNIPAGLGEPCFEKFQAVLCKELLQLPTAYSFEVGSGFEGTTMRGSEHNDLFIKENDSLRPATNNAGGVLGGITNGNPVFFRIHFKSVDLNTELLIKAISSVIILDFILVQKVRKLLP